jgi:prepilin-type processing-associated H-X9-DG protein
MRRPRFRFTVRRMIVAVAIVALPLWLISLAHEMRLNASTQDCSSNMRQIALGVVQIASGRIPAGAAMQAGAKPEDRWSWLVELEAFDDAGGGAGHVIDTFGNQVPTFRGVSKLFLCPSNSNHSLPNGEGLTHYVGIAGLGLDAPMLPLGHPRVGVFGYDRRIRLDDIKDGLSNTMMIAETCRSNGARVFGGPGTVRGLDPSRQPYIDRQFGGTHRGGANVAFPDGSVRFVKDTVDPRVFEAMSTIAGGEVLAPGLHH